MHCNMKNKNVSAVERLRQDYIRIKKDPVPYAIAEPMPSNILEWHYVIQGPEDTPYEGGYYHGKLIFPKEYPFKPPSIYMITPNGRFKTNTKICLSISDYHPDSWNPAWNVASILIGLLSFMIEDTKTLGSVKSTTFEKKQFAYQSLRFNVEDKVFQELFPELCMSIKTTLESRRESQQQREEIEAAGDGVQFPQQQEANNQNLVLQALVNNQNILLQALANIAVVVGFTAFAYSVEYVLKNVT